MPTFRPTGKFITPNTFTVAAQTVVANAVPSEREPRRKFRSFSLRLLKRKPADKTFKQLKNSIASTGQEIGSKTWCSLPDQDVSSFGLEDLLMGDASSELREFLKPVFPEFEEYKKKDKENQRKREKEKKKRLEIEQTLEVVESRIIGKGSVYHKFERVAPKQLTESLRTLDPRETRDAVPPIPPLPDWILSGSCMVSSSGAANRPKGTNPDRPATSGSIMERSRGVSRTSQVTFGISQLRLHSREGSAVSSLEEAKRQDSPQVSRRESSTS